MNNPADPQSLAEKLNRIAETLSDPRLSADGVVDLTYELADIAQRAALELELSGEREEAVALYDRLARKLRETASQRPDDERYLIESVADFWALTADSWRSTSRPAQMPEPERSARAKGYLPYDSLISSSEQPRPGPVRPSSQSRVSGIESFRPRTKSRPLTGLQPALREAVSQKPGDQRHLLGAVKAFSQLRSGSFATSTGPMKPGASKDIARLRRTLPPKGSK